MIERSIPSGIDGLKTSQRKILYTCLKRNLTSEIKVAQLGGCVSEKSRYHHGEQSLYGAIIGMAQDFTGSNNINLLEPNGQFGTRLQGGDDAASERYICTQLSKITRFIFPQEDDHVLNYLEDDGTMVEPMFYVPIIPMQLINGGKGIGTGFSTDILNYNPLTIIDYVKAKLLDKINNTLNNDTEPQQKLFPFYSGFKGTITSLNEKNNKYLIKGVYNILSDKQVRITELPIGVWTDDYKKHIEELIDYKPVSTQSDKDKDKDKDKDNKKKTVKQSSPQIKDYTDMSTDKTVDITITFANGIINDLRNKIVEYESCTALEKLLKLYTTRSTTNMHVFDDKEKLIKFDNVETIIEHFMKVRYEFYEKRKKYQIDYLNQNYIMLSNKARFITEILENTLDLRRKKTAEVSSILNDRKYDIIDNDSDYKYLVRLPMDSVTEENIEKILLERDRKQQDLEKLISTSENELWLNELELLRKEYLCLTQKKEEENKEISKSKVVVKKNKVGKKHSVN